MRFLDRLTIGAGVVAFGFALVLAGWGLHERYDGGNVAPEAVEDALNGCYHVPEGMARFVVFPTVLVGQKDFRPHIEGTLSEGVGVVRLAVVREGLSSGALALDRRPYNITLFDPTNREAVISYAGRGVGVFDLKTKLTETLVGFAIGAMPQGPGSETGKARVYQERCSLISLILAGGGK